METSWAGASGGQQTIHLTSEERQVLALAATGRMVVEVAEYLGQSPETIRHTLASAIHNLGARSKIEAVLLALRHGLIEPPGD
jgi:DNA-binding NarL/FixJ family response regulator